MAESIGIESDYRFRGESLTNGQPALWGDISYDHPSGAYVSLVGLAALASEKPFLGVIADLGYAKRLNRHLTVDVGALRSELRAAAPRTSAPRYTELYAGGYFGPLSARVYYSPAYRAASDQTLYAELNADAEPLARWHVSGHVGMLTYLRSSGRYPSPESRGDWRVTVSRKLGRLELHAALVKGGRDYDSGYARSARAKITLGASASF